MTIDEMRALVGLAAEASDAEVVAAYAAMLTDGAATAQPLVEPVTLAQAKQHLRITDDSQDMIVAGYISAARDWVEKFTGVLLAEREVAEGLDGLLPGVALRAWPITRATPVRVSYRTAYGEDQLITDAVVASAVRPARLFPAARSHWPLVGGGGGAAYAIVTAGFPDPADVPSVLRQAMLILIGAYDADREGGDLLLKSEAAARRLCSQYRMRRL